MWVFVIALVSISIALTLRPIRQRLLTLVLYVVLGIYTHTVQWSQRMPVHLDERQTHAKGHLPLTSIDWHQGDASSVVRQHLRSSTPLRITNVPPWVREALFKLTPPQVSETSSALASRTIPPEPASRISIQTSYFPSLGPFGKHMRTHWNLSAIYAARFSGTYTTGFAHMDFFASYNVYYVFEGTKRVQMIPWYHSESRPLAYGFDSAYVKGSIDDQQWHKAYPSYYEFDVSTNDILLFNSSACIHKFTNLTNYTDIVSIHTSSQYAAPVVHRGERWNWETAGYFSGIVMDGKTERNPYQI